MEKSPSPKLRPRSSSAALSEEASRAAAQLEELGDFLAGEGFETLDISPQAGHSIFHEVNKGFQKTMWAAVFEQGNLLGVPRQKSVERALFSLLTRFHVVVNWVLSLELVLQAQNAIRDLFPCLNDHHSRQQ